MILGHPAISNTMISYTLNAKSDLSTYSEQDVFDAIDELDGVKNAYMSLWNDEYQQGILVSGGLNGRVLCEWNSPTQSSILIDPNDTEEPIALSLVDPPDFPSQAVVCKEWAKKACAVFLQTGKLDDSLSWKHWR